MMLGLFALFLGLFGLFSGSLWFFYKRSRQESQLVRRVEALSRSMNAASKGSVPFVVLDDHLSKIPLLDRALENLDVSRSLSRLLDQAGSSTKVGHLVLQMLVMAGLGFLAGAALRANILKWILMLMCGAVPLIRVHLQRARRLKAFIRAFPDTLDMMTSAIKAGHAFNQAMQLVGDEAPYPIGIEFKRTFEQYNLGINLREALLNLTTRVDSLDLKLFVTAILLQRETGGNLAEILEKISYTIRERFKLIGQIKTYTAQGRMSAWIVGTLPAVFVLAISVLNPAYLEPLLQEKLGHLMIGFSAFLQIAGLLFIRRIVRIKYQ
ncbi:type II secretion system F family protein [bacterium]|nr:type II secretion system F family protein [bacterium]